MDSSLVFFAMAFGAIGITLVSSAYKNSHRAQRRIQHSQKRKISMHDIKQGLTKIKSSEKYSCASSLLKARISHLETELDVESHSSDYLSNSLSKLENDASEEGVL